MTSIVSEESLAKDRPTDRETGRQTLRQRERERQAGRQTDRQTDRLVYVKICKVGFQRKKAADTTARTMSDDESRRDKEKIHIVTICFRSPKF